MADADQEQRADESRREPDDKFHQAREEEQVDRAELADELADVPAERD